MRDGDEWGARERLFAHVRLVVSSSALADMGGGATFFDNLVEVRRAEQVLTSGPATS